MAENYQQYTVTMARVLASQGHWGKAAEIYRHLLRWETGREDLRAALAEAERHCRAAAPTEAADLAPLFARWMDLLTRYQRIRRLQRRLGRPRPSGGTP
jgi:hypothetical protein